MLILTRKISSEERPESIFIGDNIEVIVLGIQGKQVRLGINAPDNVNIVRSELLNGKGAAV